MQPDTSSILRSTLSRASKAARVPAPPGAVCCARGCANSERDHPGKVFYALPAAPAARSRWLKLVDRRDLETLPVSDTEARVCSDHFAPHDYTPRKSLREDAVPSLMLYKDAVPSETPTDSTPVVKAKTEPAGHTFETEFRDESNASPDKRSPDPYDEELISVHIETQCEETDPLAIVKDELSDTASVATQTFTRRELFFSVATRTGAETIELPSLPSRQVSRDWEKRTVQVQTTKNLLNYYTLPVKRRLETEIRATKKKIQKLETAQMDQKKFMICSEKYLNEKIANILKSHSQVQMKYVGNRYGHDFKTLALNLYMCNPQSYKFVEQIFNLPSRQTLQRLQAPARTGINANLIEYLKIKANKMTEKEKLCAICFDVMRVSRNLWFEVSSDLLCGMQEIDQVAGPEPAAYAAVLMVRGLYTKWTQPVSFALMSDKRNYPELKEWVHKIIGTLFDIGLNIRAFVCDLETEFMETFVKPESHYFEIDGRRIHQFYDVRYLFKSMRDQLMQYDFHVGSKVAQWNHLLKVYGKDKKHDLRLLPEIKEEHVRPTGDSLNDVDLAIKVFRKPVAAAMHFHVTANMVNQKANATVEFIFKMSDLFDILTSKTLARAYRGTTEQEQILTDVLAYLKDLEVKDRHGNAMDGRFVTGLMVNIRSVLALLDELKQESIQYIFTKTLSTDCAEKFFDECRRLGGNCCERPTPIMFARSFRRLFLFNIVHNTKDGDNEQDLKSTLYQLEEYVNANKGKKDEPENEKLKRILAGVSDFKIKWPSTEYIAGYLLWKCLEKHRCLEFLEKLSSQYNVPVENDAAILLANFRKYNADNIDSVELWKPPESLVEFVDIMDQKYNEYYGSKDREPMNFAWNTYHYMEEDSFELPCECFPLKFMKILFIRLKIEHCVREHNKLSKNPRRSRQQAKRQNNRKSK